VSRDASGDDRDVAERNRQAWITALVVLLAVVLVAGGVVLNRLWAGGLPDCMPCPDEVVRSVPLDTTP
jgi:hypothetical protein